MSSGNEPLPAYALNPPHDWETKRLESICDRITKGTTPTKDAGWAASGVAFVKVEAITSDGRVDIDRLAYIDDETNRALARSKLERDDILFSIAGAIGRCALVPLEILPANTNQALAIVRPKAQVVPRFLYYFLSWPAFTLHAKTRVVQSVQANLSLSVLGSTPVLLPPYNEQLRITHVLETLDAAIEANRAMNSTMEALARALFRSWFVDFDPVRAKMERRPTGLPDDVAALFPERMVDSAMGEVPEGWRAGTLADVAKFNVRSLGKDSTLSSVEYVEISGVGAGRIEATARHERGYEPSRAKRVLAHGDTVMSTVRPERRNFFLAHHPAPDLIASTGFAVLSPKECAWPWLYIAATRPEVFEELGRLADGGAYPAVRPDTIGSLPLVIPPIELAAAFAKVTEPLLDRIHLNLAQNRTLAKTRDTLLPKLLSGEIRIPAEAVS